MASTYLTRTPSSNGNRKTWTFSAWCKVQKDSNETIFDVGTNGSNNYTPFFFQNDQTIRLYEVVGGTLQSYNLITNRKFRDRNAWYHLVYRVDTTQSTASDRIRLYVNGVQETSFSTAAYPAQNYDTLKNSTSYANVIGVAADNYGANFYDGLMSHVHFCDGYSYAPTEFGETDSTTGEWKIKTSPNVQYGTNGFFILKDGNSVTDQSGNSNNFTVGGGTLTKTEDNPSNVFATLNPLVPDAGSSGLFHGNNQLNVNTANWRSAFSTLGMSSGKFYFESYIEAGGYIHIGARGVEQSDGSLAGNNDWIGVTSQGWSYDKTGEIRNNNSSVASGKATYGNTDIIGCLLDLDNWTINWTKNGTLINSTAYSITQNLTYVFGVSGHSTARIRTNFGNGYFQTTAVSSAGSNASGLGIFEYDVPTGYTALCTKGLNL